MGKFDKFKDILKIATPIAKPFVPGAAGTILDQVNGILNDPKQPNEDAVKALAARVDEYNNEQDKAILALHDRLKKAGI
jgi:hypothetical protein